eukprot:SAG25_NODE_3653_length_1011_cov_4.869369_3_plen_54_part_00
MKTATLKKQLKAISKLRLAKIDEEYNMGLLTGFELIKQKETENKFTKNIIKNL